MVVFWNGREGFDFVLNKNGQDAFKRLIEGFDQVAQYAKEKVRRFASTCLGAKAERAESEHVSGHGRRGTLFDQPA